MYIWVMNIRGKMESSTLTGSEGVHHLFSNPFRINFLVKHSLVLQLRGQKCCYNAIKWGTLIKECKDYIYTIKDHCKVAIYIKCKHIWKR
jgi:hypothetical protein